MLFLSVRAVGVSRIRQRSLRKRDDKHRQVITFRRDRCPPVVQPGSTPRNSSSSFCGYVPSPCGIREEASQEADARAGHQTDDNHRTVQHHSILSRATRRLPHDWQTATPVLAETFVDAERSAGTCYRAANWIHVGRTQGRGKLGRHHTRALPSQRRLHLLAPPRLQAILTTAP
jgi:hypothetical protein